MTKQKNQIAEVKLEKIVGGGQAIGKLESGKKILVWSGLPGETVEVQITKKKSNLNQGVVTKVAEASSQRISPRDADSYLSTSPWQIMDFAAEQHYKAALIEEAFELHDIVLPDPIEVYSDGQIFNYRNKIEFSWWWDNDKDQLDLAFFRRGTHGKIPVEGTSLARPEINHAAVKLRDILRKRNTAARQLKTVMIRSSQGREVAVQLYVTDENFAFLTDSELAELNVAGFELIYSNPKSPASIITERKQTFGNITLTDTILGVPFHYAVDGFFQINLPIYQQALSDMKQFIDAGRPVVDMYSGVGSIGLTIGGDDVTLVEINQSAHREMERNIAALGRENSAKAVLAASEKALNFINPESTIIVDPPRAGLHTDLIEKLLEAKPPRIIYLSCNPVTQARDVARLAEVYGVKMHRGYNFFPRTPHIENLVVLDIR